MTSKLQRIYQRGNVILIALSAITCTFSTPAFSQDLSKEDKSNAKRANRYYKAGKINQALPLYMELADKFPTNVEFNYRTGICLNNTDYFIDIIGSVPYFENASKNNTTDTIPEIYYYLGHAYQMLNRFEDAIDAYQILKRFVEPVRVMDEGIAEIDENILRCEYGIQIRENKNENIRIENLGTDVNSKYAEYAPVISPDGNDIYFTSTRNTTTGGKSTFDGEYYEDVYVAKDKKKGRKWYAPKVTEKHGVNNNIFHNTNNLPQPINTKYDDAVLCMSNDGNELYIFKDNSIYVTQKSGESWSMPVLMNENINLRNGYQSHISISADGNQLFLVSEQYSDYIGYDGYGGKDIYVCEKDADGNWGPPENLGETINSPWDEESPFLSSDGYLYFASRGHGNIGGYDIFRSKFENDAWTEPENVGLPINSGGDDIFYIETPDGTRAYFSSERGQGYGDMDIYTIPLVPITKFLAAEYENGNSTPIAATVKVVSKTNPEDTATFAEVSEDQLQEFYLLPDEKYEIIVSAKDYRTKSIDVSVPKQGVDEPYYQEVTYQKIKDTDGSVIGQKTTFYSAFFNIDSAVTANPKFSNIPDRDQAYSAIVKTMEASKEEIDGFDVAVFTEYNFKELAEGKDNIFAHLGEIQDAKDNKAINASLSQVISLTSNDSVRIFAERAMAANDPEEKDFYINKMNENLITVDEKTGIVEQPIATVAVEPVVATTEGEPTTTGTEVETGITMTEPTKETAKPTETEIAATEPTKETTTTTQPTETEVAATEPKTETGTTTEPTGTEVAATEPKTETGTTTEPTETEVAVTETGTTTTTTTTISDDGTTATKTTKMSGGKAPSFEPALFGFDQFNIEEGSKEKIDKVYAYLTANKDASVEIYGHTDSKGSQDYNQRLSVKRAQAAVEYLVAKGISRDRLKAVGKGELSPIAPNENPDKSDNPEGRRLNRRVEFKASGK